MVNTGSSICLALLPLLRSFIGRNLELSGFAYSLIYHTWRACILALFSMALKMITCMCTVLIRTRKCKASLLKPLWFGMSKHHLQLHVFLLKNCPIAWLKDLTSLKFHFSTHWRKLVMKLLITWKRTFLRDILLGSIKQSWSPLSPHCPRIPVLESLRCLLKLFRIAQAFTLWLVKTQVKISRQLVIQKTMPYPWSWCSWLLNRILFSKALKRRTTANAETVW